MKGPHATGRPPAHPPAHDVLQSYVTDASQYDGRFSALYACDGDVSSGIPVHRRVSGEERISGGHLQSGTALFDPASDSAGVDSPAGTGADGGHRSPLGLYRGRRAGDRPHPQARASGYAGGHGWIDRKLLLAGTPGLSRRRLRRTRRLRGVSAASPARRSGSQRCARGRAEPGLERFGRRGSHYGIGVGP